jgi:hypothetical protein
VVGRSDLRGEAPVLIIGRELIHVWRNSFPRINVCSILMSFLCLVSKNHKIWAKIFQSQRIFSTKLYLSIFGPARAEPAHGPYWTGMDRDLEVWKKNLARARPEMLFLVILHYKMRGRPTQVWARPENCDPTRPMGWSWARFSQPEKPGFFSDRPMECSGLHKVKARCFEGSFIPTGR